MSAMDAGARAMLKRVSRSMYLSLAALPAEVRDAMGLGYLLCRAADTIADTRLVPGPERLRTLEAYRAAFSGGPAPSASLLEGYARHQASPDERELLTRLQECVGLWRAFPEEERALLRRVVEGVVDGMRMDLSLFPGETEAELRAMPSAAELERYCGFIGGEPGRFWTDLCVLRVPALSGADAAALRDLGYRLGKGLQITNILRDIPKDLRLGRCYLPDLAAAGLSPEELLEPSSAARLRPVLARWLRWALGELGAGAGYVERMPALRLKAAAAWPLLLSLRTLTLVARAGEDLLRPGRLAKVGRGEVYRMILGTPWTLGSEARFARRCAALRAELEAAIG